jgi:hypothetical protein
VAHLVAEPERIARLGERARRWVVEQRTWERVMASVPDAYAAAAEAAGR